MSLRIAERGLRIVPGLIVGPADCGDEARGMVGELFPGAGGLREDFVEAGGFYRTTAEPDSRSLMNITFRLPNEDLEKRFVQQALENGLGGLKGHRSVGGCRASIYNAVPLEAVESLVDFMKMFEKENG